MHMLDFTPNSETKEMYFQLLLNYDAFQSYLLALLFVVQYDENYTAPNLNSQKLLN